MKKSLVVLGLLFLASLASAQTFGFGTAGGSYLYCNYIQLFNTGGDTWAGTDNLSACGLGVNGTVVGVKGGISKTGNPLGFALKGVTYGDNLYDAIYYFDTGLQWDVTQNLKCTHIGSKKVKEGWLGLAAYNGTFFGYNFGVLACEIPGKGNAPVKGLSIGSAKLPSRR